ncbi:MAG: hypothetical protein HRT86_02240 [Ilumatobacteraceae bacterium]|nr:hypothetical protein [Ilumatobacteraceae bacterium]
MSDQFAAMFRRRPNSGWFTAGRYDVTTVDILCGLAVVTMFIWALSRTLWDRLLFFPPAVRDFEVWRVVTWPIATEPAIWPLLGIVFFFLFGQQLEALFGRNKFVVWVLAVTTIPAVIMTFVGSIGPGLDLFIEAGLSNLFLAGIWVYAATYPGVKWFEVVPLWVLAAVFTLLQLLQFTGAGQSGNILFLLALIAVSLSAGRSLGLATGWPIPHIPLSASGSGRSRSPRRQKRSKPSRSRQKVVEGPWQQAPPPPPPTSVADQAELDALLDKIGANGMDALSGAEKQRLNELSKRLRKQ